MWSEFTWSRIESVLHVPPQIGSFWHQLFFPLLSYTYNMYNKCTFMKEITKYNMNLPIWKSK